MLFVNCLQPLSRLISYKPRLFFQQKKLKNTFLRKIWQIQKTPVPLKLDV